MTGQPDAESPDVGLPEAGPPGAAPDGADDLGDLLQRVEKGEIDPATLSLAPVTAAGLSRLLAAAELDLDAATGFFLQAARLLDLKSRALLPPEQPAGPDEAGEAAGEAGGEALVERLLAYRGFKEAAGVLRRFEEAQARRFPRGTTEDLPAGGPPGLAGVSLDDLLAAFQRIWEQASEVAPPHEIPREEITVGARMRLILRSLRRAPDGEATFSSLFRGQATRREVIVTFLAILELVRLGRVALRQEISFGEILIRHRAAVENPDAGARWGERRGGERP